MEKTTVTINIYKFSDEERDILGKAFNILDDFYFDYSSYGQLSVSIEGETYSFSEEEMSKIVSALDIFAHPDAKIKVREK